MTTRTHWHGAGLAVVLVALVCWLRGPSLSFPLWNVDEAIHAAAARTLLDGGVLYRDTIDQRTPLTYYVVAAIFSVAGENNLPAVRLGLALLIAATAWLLAATARRLQGPAAGLAAGLAYAVVPTVALFQGDAFAANTEWFVAFFSAAAVAVWTAGGPSPSPRRLAAVGALFAGAFLSKQPALLDAGAAIVALAYLAWRERSPARAVATQIASFAAGWMAPVALVGAYLAARGALADMVFYTWTYNLHFYGPELGPADRLGALAVPWDRLTSHVSGLTLVWLAGAAVGLARLVQRQPAAGEEQTNPTLALVAAWTVLSLAGGLASGRAFDHYFIQFLPAFCLGAGLALGRLATWVAHPATPRAGRIAAAAILALVAVEAAYHARTARTRTLPEDPSHRVANYIRTHSSPADRIFVWGYHPDVYLFADRKPASRFTYCSFLTGLIPWTNTAPDKDTAYAIVPGAMTTLLQDLAARPPRYVVDCSPGPNRHWQKYPPENYPAFRDWLRQHYRQIEAHQFIPQGFRLYERRAPDEPADVAAPGDLPETMAAQLRLEVRAAAIVPSQAAAQYGAHLSRVGDRTEYFVHAPSVLAYRLPPGAHAVRGGFGIEAGAYAPGHAGPTDGAEFTITWRPDGGPARVLLRRLLRPLEEPRDRGVQDFQLALPDATSGELEFATGTGPADNAASDWTFWTELRLETSP